MACPIFYVPRERMLNKRLGCSKFSTPRERIRAVAGANKYNERSIVEDTEYASSMYYLKINNKNVVFYDKPEKGERDNVTVVIDLKEGKRKLAGLIHSHSATSKDHLANQFSEKDLDVFKKYKTIGYVATPSGKLLQNVLGDKEATSIISDKIPSDKNDPESPLYFKTKSNSNE